MSNASDRAARRVGRGTRRGTSSPSDTLENPPFYTQVDDPAEAFAAGAALRGIEARILEPGDELDLCQPSCGGDTAGGDPQASLAPVDPSTDPPAGISA